MSELVVVGSIAYDSVETPFGKRDDVLGGSATYFSIAASHFTKPGLVGVVGEDFRAEDIALLERHGVDLSGLVTAPGKTFRWGGVYSEDMNSRDTLFTELNVFEQFAPDLPQAYREANVLFLGNIQPTLQGQVLEQVTSPGFVAADTMNLWIDIAKSDLVDVLRRVDAIFVNDEEALQLTGQRTVTRAARDLLDMGPRLIVIKRGEHGAILFGSDDIFYVPAYPLEEVHDPTGAGDTFAGGFLGYLAANPDLSPKNLRRAAVVGSLLASYCVEGFSMERLSAVTAQDIRRRYEAFVHLTRFDALDF